MEQNLRTGSIATKEVVFQLILHILVFIFYCFDRRNFHVSQQEVVYFFTYAVTALIINYGLLPHLFYHRRSGLFILFTVLVITSVILVEELLLEPIYFPGRIAHKFPGVFFSLAQILPVIAILVGFKFAWDAVFKQSELEALKAAAQESELQFLKSQINPHFLFNNLNNLYSYAIEYSPKTPAIILELSSVLRYMLYECKEKFVPLSKELEQLKNFTRLSELQIEERGKIDFRVSDFPSGYQIAPLILIVFIENAFKHSQSSQSTDIVIDIQILVSEEGKLHFVCRNSFHPKTNHENLAHGIGLENVKKRLQLIYPGDHTLVTKLKNNEFVADLSIQLTKIP